MPIRHVKDRSGLISRTKLRGRHRRHYLLAYLWEDRAAMSRGAGDDGDPSVLGWWVEQAWRWLWEIDPHGRHAPP